MAVTEKAVGIWTSGAAQPSLQRTPPGTPAAGDRTVVWAAWKVFSVTATCASNGGARVYTEVTEFADGSVGVGNGTGSMKVACWYKDWESGDTDAVVTFSANPDISAATIQLLQKDANETWDAPTFVTAAIAAASAWSATSSSTITIADGAIVIELAAFRDDSATMTRDTNTALDDDGSPAVTWNGNVVELPDAHVSTTSGNDMSADLIHRLVTTGAAGVNLTATGTLSASETGACLWVHQSVTAAPVDSIPHHRSPGFVNQAVKRASSWMRRHDGLFVPERRLWAPGWAA